MIETTIGEAFNLKSGKQLSKSKMIPGEHPVFGGNGISGYHNEFMFKKPKIVIGRVGAYCGNVQRTKPYSWITDNALEMFGDPVRNEKGWEVYPIKDLGEKSKYSIKAGPFGSALKKEFYVDEGYKIYGQEQVIRDDFNYGDYFIDEKRFEKLKNCEIKKDDVLISLVGSYGYISIVPDGIKRGIINPRLMKISFDKEKILPFFFKSLFTNKSFEKLVEDQTHGGTMGILNTTIVKKLNIPVPPVFLQKSFLNKLERLKCEKAQIELSQKKSEELFSSLVQGVFPK